MEWVEIAKDLNAGTIGGVAGIIAGHPLDTIKVRLQTACSLKSNFKNSALETMKHIAQSEGIRGFYRGMLSPIISNAPINAVIFAAYGQTSRVLKEMSHNGTLTPQQQFIAGSSAGFLQTVFSCPAELIKIQLQVSKEATQLNSIQYGRMLLRKHGLKTGLFRGWTWTAMRDVPAIGIYFLSYDVSKQYLTDGNPNNETNMNLLLAGGIAGSLSWMILHPIDVVKSCVQSQKVDTPLSTQQLVRTHVQREGPGFFMKGFGATVLRAFPVSAVTFLVYEKCMLYMS